MKVSALLVSHNGARWLPGVLAGLERSTVLPAEIVAVDTGSTDTSGSLIHQALGVSPHVLPADTTYAAAVRAGLAQLPPAEPDEWVWLLHDDAAPAEDCLEQLTAAAAEAGADYAVIGPKLREWPSLRRLLEVGVTVSGTARRETGLEPGEYDQGQHDEIKPVLAVNTAGMLVRREVLAEVGLEDRFPVLGTDLDFGWRAARRGHQAVVVPQAVMYHVEASRRGRRQDGLATRPRRAERLAAMQTLLANGPGATLPLRWLRLVLGGLLRALGFTLVRAGEEASDEAAAVGLLLLHPGQVWGMRRERRGTASVPHRRLRPLLAPVWLPYRHGLDFLSEMAVAIADTGRESMERRRAEGHSLPVRLLRSPAMWAVLAATVLALVAQRQLFTGGPLHGGALLPAPDGVGHWWSLWWSGWHWLGTGSGSAAPAYVLPLAVVGTVLIGATDVLVWLLFVLAVPLSVLSALRFTRRVTSGRWAPVWGAVAYGLVPLLSGAVQQGRLGTVVAAMLLPVVATSALGLGDRDEEHRTRALWRTTAGLGLLVAFAPSLWLVALVLALLAGPVTGRRLEVRQLVILLLVPALLVLPWLLSTLGTPGALLLDAGRADALPAHPDVWGLLLGRPGGPAAPAWISAGLPIAALVALVRIDVRTRVLRAWAVAAVAALLVAALAGLEFTLPGLAQPIRLWSGSLLLVLFGAFVVAATVAADGAVARATGRSFGWRQPLAAVAVVGAFATPVAGALWWLDGADAGPLQRSEITELPTYMTDLSAADQRGGVLVVTGGKDSDVTYRVLRKGTLRIGDDGVLAMTPPERALTRDLGGLLSGDQKGVADRLAARGIAYVYAPRPVSPAVSGALDAADGFSGASAPDRGARAWQLETTPTLSGIDRDGAPWHRLALALQLFAILAVIVLALPGRRQR